MISKMIGGGREVYVPISLGRKGKKTVAARGGLLGSGIGVITEEGYFKGMILMPRWGSLKRFVTTTRDIPKIEWTPDKIVWEKVLSIYYAIRKTFHILVEKYGVDLVAGEKKLILELIEAAQNLNLSVIGLRKENEKIYQDKINQLIEQILGRIGKTHYNLFIKEGLHYLMRLRTMKDKSGKVSETVKMVEPLTAKRRFEGRFQEILRIQPVIEERRWVLVTIRDLIEYRLLTARHFLELIKERFNLERFIAEEVEKQRIRTRLVQLATEIGQIDIQPYLFTCRMIENELKQAAANIKEQRVDQAVVLINRSLESLKLKVIQREIEDLIERMTILLFKKQLGDVYRFKGELIDISRKVGQISESGFVLQTKEKVMRELELSYGYLKVYTLGNIDLARNSLKNASDHLMELP